MRGGPFVYDYNMVQTPVTFFLVTGVHSGVGRGDDWFFDWEYTGSNQHQIN